MQLQHSVFEVNTFHVGVVITSKIGLCYIVIPWWHMNFICVACGNYYARAKLLYFLNVDQHALPLSVLFCHYGMGIFSVEK